MARDDWFTGDEAGAAGFERDNAWPDEVPDLSDLINDTPTRTTTPKETPDA